MRLKNKDHAITADWIIVIAGIWLIYAPFILHITNTTERVTDIWVGLIVAAVSLVKIFNTIAIKTSWVSLITFLVILWLIISPFTLGYINIVTVWNNVLVGVVIFISSILNNRSERQTTATHRYST